MTIAELHTEVFADIFPEGQPANLVDVHKKYVLDAIIDLEEKIPCLRFGHLEEFIQVETLFNCGATSFTAPRGYIQRLHTELITDCCAKVYYLPISADEMRCLQNGWKSCGPRQVSDYTQYYNDCEVYSDASIDRPCRASSGSFTLIGDQVVMFPSLQSNEIAHLEWDGVKRDWEDSDDITLDRESIDAIELYVERKVARRDDSNFAKAAAVASEYATKVAMLIHNCRKERTINRPEPCFTNCPEGPFGPWPWGVPFSGCACA